MTDISEQDMKKQSEMENFVRRRLLCLLLCASLLTGCQAEKSSSVKQTDSTTAEKEIFAMDTYMTVKTYGKQAEKAAQAAVDEINRLDKLLSTGNKNSEIAIVNENGSEILSEDTAVLVERSLQLYQDTEGAFNIAVYPLMKAWGFTNEKYKVPAKDTIQKLLQNTDITKLEYDKDTKQLTLPERYEIDLGGIAKGYTSDQLMRIFQKYKLDGGIVSLGGNVQMYGYKTAQEDWKVAVENPDTSPLKGDYLGVLTTTDKAVITSGGYERYFEENGKRYHHILDPKNGQPADSGLTSVTIVSEDGTLADGLSTSLFIMGKEKGEKYWKKHAGSFDVIWLESDGTITITEGLQDIFTSDFAYQTIKR